MDWQFIIGLGVAIIFGLIPYVVKDLPHGITWSGLTVAVLLILWGLIPVRGKVPLGPALLLLAGIGAVGGAAGWYKDVGAASREVASPNISFQKYVVYWIEFGPGVYRLGVAAKFYNSDSKSYLIDAVTYGGRCWTLFPRGGYLIQRYVEFEDDSKTPDEVNYLKPSNEGYIKKLLPIRVFMNHMSGDTPELLLRGKWKLLINGNYIDVVPLRFAVYSRPISKQEWDVIDPASINEMKTISIPAKPPKNAPSSMYVAYSYDPTASIENPYFAQIHVTGKGGSMVFLFGNEKLPLEQGWEVLGRSYQEIWTNQDTLSIYNNIFPPDRDNNPLPFGYFAGREAEMLGGAKFSPAPTTRSADIIEYAEPGMCQQ